MAVLAVTVFVVAYALIASDRINKTVVALSGAAIVVAVGVVGSADVFYSHDTGIDWDVIFLLLGMMIIVGVLRQTGVFEYIAIWSAKRAKGSPLRIMILLVLVTAVASALLDNVTTVLLIAPVTLLVCDRLAINPIPFLMAEYSPPTSAARQPWLAIRRTSSSPAERDCRSTTFSRTWRRS
jgi:Na+/H+ antiporter NhaD/arsenite permease-like protein